METQAPPKQGATPLATPPQQQKKVSPLPAVDPAPKKEPAEKPTLKVPKDPDDEGVIVFRGKKKTQMPCKVSPCQDSTGKHYTGQGETGYYEDLTEEDKRKLAYVVYPNKHIVI